MSECVSRIVAHRRATQGRGAARVAIECLFGLLFYGALAWIVAYPVLYHDRRGYDLHCGESAMGAAVPAWCERGGAGRGFSLYAHVQRKHWNVGLLRYYEMKQIPNFVLALPVLALSFSSAAFWIRQSWSRHVRRASGTNKNGGPGGRFRAGCRFAKDAILWAFLAAGASSRDVRPRSRDKGGDDYAANSV